MVALVVAVRAEILRYGRGQSFHQNIEVTTKVRPTILLLIHLSYFTSGIEYFACVVMYKSYRCLPMIDMTFPPFFDKATYKPPQARKVLQREPKEGPD